MAAFRRILHPTDFSSASRPVLVDAGVAAEQIVRLARARRADLIVMGTHGRTGFTRALLGSVAARVVALAACPVLTVRGR